MTQEPPPDGPDPPQTDRARPAHAPEAVQTLRRAMRRARFDDAERVGVLAEQRATQIARLELLLEALAPLLDQIPRTVDLFDVGLMPGVTPRLFIDMIAFIEMGRDAKVYRFLQDTRHRRVSLAETSDIPTMVEAITDYVARRLLERDKALASDAVEGDAAATAVTAATAAQIGAGAPAPAPSRRREPAPRRRRAGPITLAGMVFAFVIDLLGAIAFFLLLAVGGWMLWARLHGQA